MIRKRGHGNVASTSYAVPNLTGHEKADLTEPGSRS